jgi:hypothetical protein
VPAPRKEIAVHVEATFSLGLVGGARTLSPRKYDEEKYFLYLTSSATMPGAYKKSSVYSVAMIRNVEKDIKYQATAMGHVDQPRSDSQCLGPGLL